MKMGDVVYLMQARPLSQVPVEDLVAKPVAYGDEIISASKRGLS